MKIKTTYNRMESRVFTLTTADVHQALRDYVERHMGTFRPPADARQEIEVDLDGDCHAEAARVTQRFIYDSEPSESVDTPQAADAVAGDVK